MSLEENFTSEEWNTLIRVAEASKEGRSRRDSRMSGSG